MINRAMNYKYNDLHVVVWQSFALMLTQLAEGFSLDNHALQGDGLLLGTVEDLRGLLVKHDGLSIDVASPSEADHKGQAQDEAHTHVEVGN